MRIGFPLGTLLLLAVATPAQAYVRTTTEAGVPMAWHSPNVVLVAQTGDPPKNLVTGQFLRAATAAALAWSHNGEPCSTINLSVIESPDSEGGASIDGTNRVLFHRKEWCNPNAKDGVPCYDPNALAVTSVFANTKTGEILETDVEINAVVFTWADVTGDPVAAVGAQDVQNTLTHEFGHVIGLDHTCFGNDGRARPTDDAGRPVVNCGQASGEVMATTMYPSVTLGDTSKRSLAPDDIHAVCTIYGVGTHYGQNGGCSVASGTERSHPLSGKGIGIVMALTALLVVRQGRMFIRGRGREAPRSAPDLPG